mgnify:CR=1 FL=1
MIKRKYAIKIISFLCCVVIVAGIVAVKAREFSDNKIESTNGSEENDGKLEEKENKKVLKVLAVVGIVAAVAGIAYAVYRFFAPDYLEDFEDDFDDEMDEDFFDDDENEFEDDADSE